MENTKNIYEKLQAIQTELKVPKDRNNNFGGYKYRSCEDILEAVKPLLVKNKLSLRLNDGLVNIGERYYIKATATLSETDGKDNLDIIAYAREEETKKGMDGSQITGTSSSYARKYALNGLLLIDDTKDSDHTNQHEEKLSQGIPAGNSGTPYPATDKQKNFATKLWLEAHPGEKMPEETKKIIETISSRQISELIEKWKNPDGLAIKPQVVTGAKEDEIQEDFIEGLEKDQEEVFPDDEAEQQAEQLDKMDL